MLGLSSFRWQTALRYSLMPQVVPRFKALFGSGLSHVAYFVALVYSAVRLLPADHPYVDLKNIGRFGLRHVLIEAANRLELKRENFDKILLYGLVMLGLLIAFLQIVVLGLSLFMQSAIAAENVSPFHTLHHLDDLAFMFMDLVFGVPKLFDSCVSRVVPCDTLNHGQTLHYLGTQTFPFPVHYALHQMLQLYSMGLTIVAMMITSYFVVTVVAETAQTGTPFGKRFSKLWAPLRIVLAFGLLIPVMPITGEQMKDGKNIKASVGLNGAQYLVLYAAKWGSGFATNGWHKFTDILGEGHIEAHENFVSTPKLPEFTGLLQFYAVVKACAEAVFHDRKVMDGESVVKPYLVRSNVYPKNHQELSYDPFDEQFFTPYTGGEGGSGLYEFLDGADSATIVFGIYDSKQYMKYPGSVNPICGSLKFQLTDPRKPYPQDVDIPPGEEALYAEQAIDTIQRFHWDFIHRMFFELQFFMPGGALDTREGEDLLSAYARAVFTKDSSVQAYDSLKAYVTKQENAVRVQQLLRQEFQKTLAVAVKEADESSMWKMTEDLRKKGWAGAGIWYNKIAELNGALSNAFLSVPEILSYPIVMEHVHASHLRFNQKIAPADIYNPGGNAGSHSIDFNVAALNDVVKNPGEQASFLWEIYYMWSKAGVSSFHKTSGNAFVDTIKVLFGLEGLYDMRANADVHPLAQLVGVGKSMVDSAIRNIGYGIGSKATNPLLEGFLSDGNAMISSFVMSVTMLAMTFGFLLYYVVPFLPFIYFFFAVAGWVKGIFEALVGVPLWALAHIRIDGDGLPGKAAMNGYYLLLEIFIRPILTIFGLVASVSIFGALVGVLSDLWGGVMDNGGGFNISTGLEGIEDESGDLDKALNQFQSMGSVIDQFFYTIVYAMVVYMIGMSSFKMIDAVPNDILRWMGSSVTAFNDSRKNPAQTMMSSSYTGTTQVSEKLGSALGGKTS